MKALLIALAMVIGAGAWFAACGQGEGARCQVDADCSGDLICNQATQVCAKRGEAGGIDATVPLIDASIDAPDDAMVDAPTDAPPDSM